jgi:hypothetical protein
MEATCALRSEGRCTPRAFPLPECSGAGYPGQRVPSAEGLGGPLSNQPAGLSDLAPEGWCNPHAYLKMRCLLLPSPLPEVYSAPGP